MIEMPDLSPLAISWRPSTTFLRGQVIVVAVTKTIMNVAAVERRMMLSRHEQALARNLPAF